MHKYRLKEDNLNELRERFTGTVWASKIFPDVLVRVIYINRHKHFKIHRGMREKNIVNLVSMDGKDLWPDKAIDLELFFENFTQVEKSHNAFLWERLNAIFQNVRDKVMEIFHKIQK